MNKFYIFDTNFSKTEEFRTSGTLYYDPNVLLETGEAFYRIYQVIHAYIKLNLLYR